MRCRISRLMGPEGEEIADCWQVQLDEQSHICDMTSGVKFLKGRQKWTRHFQNWRLVLSSCYILWQQLQVCFLFFCRCVWRGANTYLLVHWLPGSVQTQCATSRILCALGPRCPPTGWPQFAASSGGTAHHSNRWKKYIVLLYIWLRGSHRFQAGIARTTMDVRKGRETVKATRGLYLHVLDLSEVGVLGGEQEGPRFIQLGFHPQRLIVQQGELRL